MLCVCVRVCVHCVFVYICLHACMRVCTCLSVFVFSFSFFFSTSSVLCPVGEGRVYVKGSGEGVMEWETLQKCGVSRRRRNSREI